MTQTFNDILMGGSGAPTAKITEGVTIAGRITAISQPYQEREYDKNNPGGGAPKFFPSGDPIMSFTIDVATQLRDPSIEDDDGTRRIYMDGARIKKAVKAAILASGAPGLAVGGSISITCTHYDTPGDIRSGKNYAAQYTPGAVANNVLMGQPEQPAPQPAQQTYSPNPATQPGWVPQQPAPAAPAAPAPAQAGPTPEQVAAVRSAGLDPAAVFPGYVG